MISKFLRNDDLKVCVLLGLGMHFHQCEPSTGVRYTQIKIFCRDGIGKHVMIGLGFDLSGWFVEYENNSLSSTPKCFSPASSWL